MRFTFAGSQYQLEFQRAHRDVELRRRVKEVDAETGEVKDVDQVIVQPSTYPYTTARLELLQDGKTTTVAEASVGCAVIDKYSVREGRVQALRRLTDRHTGVQDKALRKAIWQAYEQRATR